MKIPKPITEDFTPYSVARIQFLILLHIVPSCPPGYLIPEVERITEMRPVPMRMTGRTPEEDSRLSGTMTVSPAVTGSGWMTPTAGG